jgi:peroxin-11B
MQPLQIEKTFKFLSTTTGRDRVNRFVQFFAKFLALQFKEGGLSKETIEKLTRLSSHVALCRKLMRLGRPLEFYNASIKALPTKDSILRYTTVSKNSFMGLWLLFDSMAWAHGVGLTVFTKEKLQQIQRTGNKCWLIALISGVLNSAYKLRINRIKNEMEVKALKQDKVKGVVDEGVLKSLKGLKKEKDDLLFALTQDTLDMSIPSSALEYLTFVSPSLVALFASTTSIMGAHTFYKNL